ncbi:MAG: DUF3093 domain-containing protein [Mycobacteriaceae bacterium]
MAESASPAKSGPGVTALADPTYSERLWVPWWWLPIGMLAAGLLAAEIHMGAPGVRAWLPYVVLIPASVWVLTRLGSLRVEVRDGEFRVGEAHIPLTLVARAAQVPAGAKRAALGRQLDPAAFVQHRTWVPMMVLLVLDDPEDPTPYWLVSTRHPDRLLAAIADANPGATSS